MQTAHAIGGLGELLHHQGAVFELGLASVDSPDAPPMSPEQLCRAAMALDQTRPEECEKAELTLRHACLVQYMVARLYAGQKTEAAQVRARAAARIGLGLANPNPNLAKPNPYPDQAEILVSSLQHLRRILSFRNLCVYSAHVGALPPTPSPTPSPSPSPTPTPTPTPT